ncbi:hypothetical protein D3C78_979290 [compost metagenome]
MHHGLGNDARIDGRFDGGAAIRLQHAGCHGARHFGAGIADIDLSAGNVEPPAIQRGGFCKSGDRMFGRGIWRRPRPRRGGGNRAIIDDAATLRRLRLHLAKRRLGAEKSPCEVSPDHGIPGFERHIFDMHRRCGHAGIIDQKIEATETPDDFRKQPLDIGRSGNISRDGQNTVFMFAPFGGGSVENLPPPARYRDLVTIFQERFGNRLADPCSSTRDERDLSITHAAFPSSSSSTCA